MAAADGGSHGDSERLAGHSKTTSAGSECSANGADVGGGGTRAPWSPSAPNKQQPLILITDSAVGEHSPQMDRRGQQQEYSVASESQREQEPSDSMQQQALEQQQQQQQQPEDEFEEIDGIRYRIVAAVTKPRAGSIRRAGPQSPPVIMELDDGEPCELQPQGSDKRRHHHERPHTGGGGGGVQRKISSIRRKSSAMVANLANLLGPSASNHELGGQAPQRRLSIYEMTKSPPPETSLEIYLSERRRSSTVSSKLVQQQILEQQSTFETNYCARQQYFKDLNQKLINQDKKLLNVVANRGQIHRHSVDIAQLPLHLAQAKASKSSAATAATATDDATGAAEEGADQESGQSGCDKAGASGSVRASRLNKTLPIGGETHDQDKSRQPHGAAINQLAAGAAAATSTTRGLPGKAVAGHARAGLLSIHQDRSPLLEKRGSTSSSRHSKRSRIVIRKFQKLDASVLHSTPAPDVKIGQRVAYKEYYGNEFGTIRWIGRVPQICPDWTVGVEFDNAIGEGDGSLNGRRYFIAKDCFAKFLSLSDVALVDQHVGRPEPGTMISVMSAAVRPGQMISIQRVSTVHVQHCFLNAPHQIPGADILAVNTRLHCQCPNCGPCAHVIKPPRTQRIARAGKNATHMCQFSTYTCCGMESQEETMCTYKGNKAASLPQPPLSAAGGLPPLGNSWFEGAGYLSQLQAQQCKLMPEEYKLGAAPEDITRSSHRSSSRRGSGKQHRQARELSVSPQPQPPEADQVLQVAAWSPASSPIPVAAEVSDSHQLIGENEKTGDTEERTVYEECPPSYTPPADNSQFIVACPDKANWVEPVWCEPPPPPAPKEKGGKHPKSARVVYRDSIENRYLFPTDEPIDSKLEADLEDLSQARYGHSMGNSSSSRLNGPRNIFKSLRSLFVSCSSTQSNHSELDRHSEYTINFSEFKPKGTRDNKTAPTIVSHAEKPIRHYAQNNNHTSNIHDNYTNEHMNNYNNDNSSSISPKLKLKEELKDFDSRAAASWIADFQKKQLETGNKQKNGEVVRHISSSSDCGFSSASQNSVNFHQSITTRPCSPSISDDEERKRFQIYKNFLNQLTNSTTIKGTDLDSLQRILFGRHPERCCLHGNIPVDDSRAQTILVDELHKSSYLHSEQIDFDSQIQRAASACCHSANSYRIPISGRGGCEESKEMNFEQESGYRQTPASTGQARSLCGNSSICGSATLSSDDSSKVTPANGDGSNNSIASSKDNSVTNTTSNNLPKAFELKLTLSINSDKATDQQATGVVQEAVVNPSGQHIDSSLSGSTFNINIVSSKNQDCSLKTNDNECNQFANIISNA